MLRLFQTPLRCEPPFPTNETLLDDLELSQYLGRYFDDPREFLTADPETIRERNAICRALMDDAETVDSLQKFVDAAMQISETASAAEIEPIQVIRSMAGVRTFRNAALALVKLLSSKDKLPAAFGTLADELRAFVDGRYPENFDEAWERFADGVEKTESFSWQLIFSRELTIEAIALTGVHSRRYRKNSLRERVSGGAEPMRVDSLLSLEGEYSEAAKLKDPHAEATARQRFGNSIKQMLVTQANQAKKQIFSMERQIARKNAALVDDLRFALGMARYAKETSKCDACFAEIRGVEERRLRVSGMVHPLFIEGGAVANDVSIGDGGEIVLLGGVNGGGKTTFLRTAGAMQVLFQLGLPLPAKNAQISPASGIFSVFAREENTELLCGKLGRELIEMREAIAALDGNGLFLGNEPISATSPAESYLLSRESLLMLKARYARGIWATHLYRLFADAERLNSLAVGSKFAPMRTEDGGKRRFLILQGPPHGRSGAKELFNYHVNNSSDCRFAPCSSRENVL